MAASWMGRDSGCSGYLGEAAFAPSSSWSFAGRPPPGRSCRDWGTAGPVSAHLAGDARGCANCQLICAGDPWRSGQIHAAVLSGIQGSSRTAAPAAAKA